MKDQKEENQEQTTFEERHEHDQDLEEKNPDHEQVSEREDL